MDEFIEDEDEKQEEKVSESTLKEKQTVTESKIIKTESIEILQKKEKPLLVSTKPEVIEVEATKKQPPKLEISEKATITAKAKKVEKRDIETETEAQTASVIKKEVFFGYPTKPLAKPLFVQNSGFISLTGEKSFGELEENVVTESMYIPAKPRPTLEIGKQRENLLIAAQPKPESKLSSVEKFGIFRQSKPENKISSEVSVKVRTDHTRDAEVKTAEKVPLFIERNSLRIKGSKALASELKQTKAEVEKIKLKLEAAKKEIYDSIDIAKREDYDELEKKYGKAVSELRDTIGFLEKTKKGLKAAEEKIQSLNKQVLQLGKNLDMQCKEASEKMDERGKIIQTQKEEISSLKEEILRQGEAVAELKQQYLELTGELEKEISSGRVCDDKDESGRDYAYGKIEDMLKNALPIAGRGNLRGKYLKRLRKEFEEFSEKVEKLGKCKHYNVACIYREDLRKMLQQLLGKAKETELKTLSPLRSDKGECFGIDGRDKLEAVEEMLAKQRNENLKQQEKIYEQKKEIIEQKKEIDEKNKKICEVEDDSRAFNQVIVGLISDKDNFEGQEREKQDVLEKENGDLRQKLEELKKKNEELQGELEKANAQFFVIMEAAAEDREDIKKEMEEQRMRLEKKLKKKDEEKEKQNEQIQKLENDARAQSEENMLLKSQKLICEPEEKNNKGKEEKDKEEEEEAERKMNELMRQLESTEDVEQLKKGIAKLLDYAQKRLVRTASKFGLKNTENSGEQAGGIYNGFNQSAQKNTAGSFVHTVSSVQENIMAVWKRMTLVLKPEALSKKILEEATADAEESKINSEAEKRKKAVVEEKDAEIAELKKKLKEMETSLRQQEVDVSIMRRHMKRRTETNLLYEMNVPSLCNFNDPSNIRNKERRDDGRCSTPYETPGANELRSGYAHDNNYSRDNSQRRAVSYPKTLLKSIENSNSHLKKYNESQMKSDEPFENLDAKGLWLFTAQGKSSISLGSIEETKDEIKDDDKESMLLKLQKAGQQVLNYLNSDYWKNNVMWDKNFETQNKSAKEAISRLLECIKKKNKQTPVLQKSVTEKELKKKLKTPMMGTKTRSKLSLLKTARGKNVIQNLNGKFNSENSGSKIEKNKKIAPENLKQKVTTKRK